MMTASSVFMLWPSQCGVRRTPRSTPSGQLSRSFRGRTADRQFGRDQRVHTREVGPDVALPPDTPGGIPPEPPEQRLEESLHGGGVHDPNSDALAELRGQRLRPFREPVELLEEVLGQARLELLLMHLAPQPGDLPGHLTVLSVLVIRGDIRDDFHPKGTVER